MGSKSRRRTWRMSKRLFDYNKQTGETEFFHHDHSTGKSYIETVQDVQPYIDRNIKLQNTPEYKERGKKQEFMHIATIPNNVIIKIKKDHNIDVFNSEDLPKLERLLMSNEYKYLRTVDRI